MRLRPTEVKAVAALLDSPADDVTDLARTVIQTLDEMRAARDVYVILLHNPGVGIVAFGTFDTRKQAERFMQKEVGAATEGARAGIRKLIKEWGEE